jgi:hypothetical protein
VGWSRIDLEIYSTYFDLYRPSGVDTAVKAPVIVFLHRGGEEPGDYREALQAAADAANAVLALPLATSNFGWGFPNDAGIVNATVESLQDLITVNESRIALAGHGDGASFALDRVLDPGTAFSAFFGIGNNNSLLPAPAELEHLPPVRLLYGEDDPARESTMAALQGALEARGITVETEVVDGADAEALPAASIETGFAFLVAQSRAGLVTQYGCENGEETICLTGGRFRVTVDWESADGNAGAGKVADLRSDGSGLFWFFNPLNWELLVKVLDACAINEHYWVFLAASTNLEYTITVEDLLAQTSVVYTNPQGQAAPAVNDTSALDTCDASE